MSQDQPTDLQLFAQNRALHRLLEAKDLRIQELDMKAMWWDTFIGQCTARGFPFDPQRPHASPYKLLDEYDRMARDIDAILGIDKPTTPVV